MNWSACAAGWIAISSVLGVAFSACSSSTAPAQATTDAGETIPDGGPGVSPIADLSSANVAAFYAGEIVFNTTMGPSDGLGPLYTKQACSDCHTDAARGPGAATKMAVVEGDGITPLSDQSLLPFGDTEHPLVVTQIPGAHTPILPPFDGGMNLGGDAGVVSIRVTNVVGPPLFGRGYLDAVDDSEIEQMASQQATRSDGVHGRVNRLTFVSRPNPDSTFDSHQTGDTVIGRFGVKARIATLDEFSADALQSDMGLTSPMRPTEFANPDSITDDLKPGVDVSADNMNARAMYVRLLAIPTRPSGTNGQAWFENCNCQVCHSETLHTRADYPIPQLANIDAPVFTDMLLHDMGTELSDSIANGNEGLAGARDWRTAPLIGLRFSKSFLHDGRAATIADAIAAHNGTGSEAAPAAQCYNNLASQFRQQIIDFVSAL
jgi:CxxC motif-containing protein (DUF1111 family)